MGLDEASHGVLQRNMQGRQDYTECSGDTLMEKRREDGRKALDPGIPVEQDCISLLRCAYCNLDRTCSEAAKKEQMLQALLKFHWQGWGMCLRIKGTVIPKRLKEQWDTVD